MPWGEEVTSICITRCMYHVLVIQLHHPLLARGHNFPAPPADAPESFALCAAAATEIVHLLVAYDRTFSIRKAPYLIAYATYVSATIHVRIAARQHPTPDTSPCLRTCLDLLNRNRETNPGVDNAKASLMGLMNRMGVVCQEDQVSLGSQCGSSHQSLRRYPSIDNSANFPLMQLSSEQSHSTSSDSRMTSNNAITPDLDTDRILQNSVDGQLSTSPTSTSPSSRMLTAQYHPALPTNREIQPVNAYDISLFDPVGMDYSQAGVGGGAQHENYTGLVAYGGPMQYTGSMSTFGA